MVPKKPNILIAEDDERYREELSQSLRAEGYEVVPARDGSEALKVINEQAVDLGLIDLNMPGVSGMDVLQGSIITDPDLPIVIITGYGTIDVAVEAIRLGAYDFIEKPVNLDRLLLTAKRAIEKRKLQQQMKWMAEDILERYKMVGTSEAMQNLYHLIDRVASADCSVLIRGETGVGKELVSMAIHFRSERANGPFVRLNCAAIPDTLVESELFGHKKGAFTGAVEDKIGKFQQADGGTIFLDEIGDLSEQAQAKLLRVLETKEFEPLGDTRTMKVDVRVIAATNKELTRAMEERTFRSDLYYRLSTVEVTVPPLRERKGDIPELAVHFLQKYCEKNNRYIEGFYPQALQTLMQHDWPGNVRQLESIIERLVLFSSGRKITANEVNMVLGLSTLGPDQKELSFKEARETFERNFITQALKAHNWNVVETARALNIDRTNLYKKMHRLGVQKVHDGG